MPIPPTDPIATSTLTPDQARAALWKAGNLTWKFHSGQKILNDTFNLAPTSLVVFNCSRQFGKTFFGVVKAIELALRKKSRIRVATAFETDLIEFVLPAFEAVLEDCPTNLRPTYTDKRKRFLFKNGSEIKLIGLDKKPNGLRGNTIDLVVLDEAGFVSKLEYLHTSVIIPLFTHRPDAKVLLLSTPPESPDHYFWDLADLARLRNSYAVFDIDSNPMLTKEDVRRIEEAMGGRHTTAFRREYLCQRIIETSRAIVPEWDDKFISEPQKNDLWPFYERYESLDIGVKVDLTVCLFGTYDFQKAKIFIEDEVWMNGPDMTTPLLASSIKGKEKELWQHFEVQHRISDNSHPLLLNDLLGLHKLPFIETDKEKLHEMVNLVRIWFGQGRIIVSPKCKQLLGCLRGGIWNEKRTEFDRSKAFGHFDALAALVYLVRNIDEGYNPVPRHPFKTFDYFIMPGEEKNQSKNADALKKAFRLK